MHHGIASIAKILFVLPGIGATPIGESEVPPGATVITFEADPYGNSISGGTLAGGTWTSLGVTFDDNDTVEGNFGLHSPPNVLSGDGSIAFEPIHAVFGPPVSLIGAWGFDFVLEIFDLSGQSLGSITHTDGSPGIYGGPSEFGFLGFSSDVSIGRAEFRRAFPDDGAFGFHIDDLAFVVVPEVPAPLLILACVAIIGVRRILLI